MTITLHASAGEVATTTGSAVRLSNQEYVALFVNVTAVAGTATPSVTFKLQESADGTNFADITSFTTAALTATGLVRIAVPTIGLKSAGWVRYVSTIAGTNPVLTYTADLATSPILSRS